MPPQKHPDRRDDRFLRWIGTLQLAKGLVVLGLAIFLLHFLHRDVEETAARWFGEIGVNLNDPHTIALLERLDLVTDRQLGIWSIFTFGFSAIFLTEGAGLLFRQEWAKYFTILATASFIPFEAYAMIEHFRPFKLILLLGNLTVLLVLVLLLRREKRRQPVGSSLSFPSLG